LGFLGDDLISSVEIQSLDLLCGEFPVVDTDIIEVSVEMSIRCIAVAEILRGMD
jgi:hypothetical protein